MAHVTLPRNFTVFLREEDVLVTTSSADRDRDYEQFMADVWVGVVLALMVLSCVCCMCSFLLYHKFQQWKLASLEQNANVESGGEVSTIDTESLPNYTLVSGLPSYDEAIEQLRQNQQISLASIMKMAEALDIPNSNEPNLPARLSVAEFLQIYKSQRIISPTAPS